MGEESDADRYIFKPPYDPPPMKVTKEEMDAAELPRDWRDSCAHLLIPLNKCRRATWYSPWTCKEEEHKYELCQYAHYKRRLMKQDYLKSQEKHA